MSKWDFLWLRLPHGIVSFQNHIKRKRTLETKSKILKLTTLYLYLSKMKIQLLILGNTLYNQIFTHLQFSHSAATPQLLTLSIFSKAFPDIHSVGFIHDFLHYHNSLP